MRKVMILAAMLAMVLVAAAPAFAQAAAVGGDVQIQNQYCPQVVEQYANADQSNTGGGIGAGIAQNLGISQSAVNACLQAGGDIGVGGTDTVVVEGAVAGESDPGVASSGTASGTASSGSTAAASSGSAAAASGGVLPDTGGASLIALGAGALLVGGGLLARKVIR